MVVYAKIPDSFTVRYKGKDVSLNNSFCYYEVEAGPGRFEIKFCDSEVEKEVGHVFYPDPAFSSSGQPAVAPELRMDWPGFRQILNDKGVLKSEKNRFFDPKATYVREKSGAAYWAYERNYQPLPCWYQSKSIRDVANLSGVTVFRYSHIKQVLEAAGLGQFASQIIPAEAKSNPQLGMSLNELTYTVTNLARRKLEKDKVNTANMSDREVLMRVIASSTGNARMHS